MSNKAPYIVEPQDQSTGKPASFIFVHGYGDDAEGIPLGLAQQFQWYNKLPYLRWVLPNAPLNAEEATRSWYQIKALPNAMKPRVPGHDEEDEDVGDDEEGILRTCDTIDGLVRGEIERGVEPGRIVVGGFSQGCAVSLVWGLVGKERERAGGMFAASGYFPLAGRIGGIREERGWGGEKDGKGVKKWLYVHGKKDVLVPGRFFEQGKKELLKWVDEEDTAFRLYDGMGHSTCNAELKDLLGWLMHLIPPELEDDD